MKPSALPLTVGFLLSSCVAVSDPAAATPTILDVETRSRGETEEVQYRLAVGDEEGSLTLQRSPQGDTILARDSNGDVTAAAMRSAAGTVAVIDGERLVTQGAAPLELDLEAEAALDPVARTLLLADTVGELPPAGLDPLQFTFVRDDLAGTVTALEPRQVRVFIGPDGGCIYWDTPQGGFDFVCWENDPCC